MKILLGKILGKLVLGGSIAHCISHTGKGSNPGGKDPDSRGARAGDGSKQDEKLAKRNAR